jgi:hypothetical protein
MAKKISESTTTANVAPARPTRLGSYLKNATVSAGSLKGQDWSNLADFLVDLPFDTWQIFEDLEDLYRVLDDIEYAGRAELNEGIFRARKSTSQKRAYSRKWYKKNKGRLAVRRRKLKSSISAKAKAKKQERLRKQRKNVKGKPLKKYPTAKGHTNENRISFAETVKDLSKKHSVKDDYPNRDKPRYFIPEKSFMINKMKITAGQKFILIGTELFFGIDGKKFKVDDPVPIIPYLKEI